MKFLIYDQAPLLMLGINLAATVSYGQTLAAGGGRNHKGKWLRHLVRQVPRS